MVTRTLGLRHLPDVATLPRGLARADAESAQRLQGLVREGVVTRLVALRLSRVTLDLDGSVIGTGKWAEGTAVGFNRKNKGQRSYYPLFYTVARLVPATSLLPWNISKDIDRSTMRSIVAGR